MTLGLSGLESDNAITMFRNKVAFSKMETDALGLPL
jgi:hypothetical protein